MGGKNYVKKKTIVTFDTRRQVNKKNKTKEKTVDKRNFTDSATDPDDFYDEGESGENDNVRLVNTKSNKKRDTPGRKNKGDHALDEMKTISVMKGKNNKQKLADILSVLKVANMDNKKARKAKLKKEDEILIFHEIPTDDITLTTEDETTGGEQNVKPEEPKTIEFEKDTKKKDKPIQQSSVDTIHLDELFSPKKKETGSVSQGEETGTKIILNVIQTDADSAKQESEDEASASEVIEVPEIYREPEVKFAKINIGGGGGAAPKKVENSVQQSKSEKKQKRADSTASLKSEEKRMSSAGSSSSSSSGAELYV